MKELILCWILLLLNCFSWGESTYSFLPFAFKRESCRCFSNFFSSLALPKHPRIWKKNVLEWEGLLMVELLCCVCQNADGKWERVAGSRDQGRFWKLPKCIPVRQKRLFPICQVKKWMFYWLMNSGPTEKHLSGCFSVSWVLSFS